jgi:hypothetical protein
VLAASAASTKVNRVMVRAVMWAVMSESHAKLSRLG